MARRSRLGGDERRSAGRAAAALQLSRAHWFMGCDGGPPGRRGRPQLPRRARRSWSHGAGGAGAPARTGRRGGRSTAPVARAALAIAERLRRRRTSRPATCWRRRWRTTDCTAGRRPTGRSSLRRPRRRLRHRVLSRYLLASHLGFAGRLGEAIELLAAMIDRAHRAGRGDVARPHGGALITNRFMVGGDPAGVAAEVRRFVAASPVPQPGAGRAHAVLSLGDLGRFDDAFGALDAAMGVLTTADDRSILLAAAPSWRGWPATERVIALAGEALAGPGLVRHRGWCRGGRPPTHAFELGRHPRATPAGEGPDLRSVHLEIAALGAVARGQPGRSIARRGRRSLAAAGPRRYQVRAQWAAGAIAARTGGPIRRGAGSRPPTRAPSGMVSRRSRRRAADRAEGPRPIRRAHPPRGARARAGPRRA